MPLTNFDFPGVSYTQIIESHDIAGPTEMAVCCIGSQYTVHRYGYADAACMENSMQYTRDEGIPKCDLPKFDKNNTVDISDEGKALITKLILRDAVVVYATITDNLSCNVSDETIKCGTPLTADFGADTEEAFTRHAVEIGDYVVITGTNSESSQVTIRTTVLRLDGNADTGVDTIRVDSLGGITTVTKVEFCIVTNATLPYESSNFQLTKDGTIRILPGLKLNLDGYGFTDCVVDGATFYIDYRERVVRNANRVIGCSSSAEIEDQIGAVCAANPLALACAFAIAGGTTVYAVPIEYENIDGYGDALDILERYDNIYSVVPTTSDPAIIESCMRHCIEVSTDPESTVRRALWYGIDYDEEPVLWEGRASIVGSTATLNSNVFVDIKFQPGDALENITTGVRYHIVDTDGVRKATIEENLDGEQALPNAPVRLVRAKPTNYDIIDNIVSKKATSSERGVCVWADKALYGGEYISNYALAAAAAGMRAGQPCHRPLSNLGYSFFSLAEPRRFTTTQLKSIGNNGIWIIANNLDGAPINKKQVTTAVANNINLDEESVIANIDNIALDVSRTGLDLVGCSNITPELMNMLSERIMVKMDKRTVNNYGTAIGPQITEWEMESIEQDPVLQDHVYAVFTFTPPRPFNKFHMSARVL